METAVINAPYGHGGHRGGVECGLERASLNHVLDVANQAFSGGLRVIVRLLHGKGHLDASRHDGDIGDASTGDVERRGNVVCEIGADS